MRLDARELKLTLNAWMFLGAVGVLAGCALPGIHREREREHVVDASAGDASARDASARDARDAQAGEPGDAGKLAEPQRETKDAGSEPDPAQDPANRNEDLETFRSNLPNAHIFAEWPMPDTAPGAAVKPSYSATDTVVTDNVTKLRWQRQLPEMFRGCTAKYRLVNKLLAPGTGCTWEEAKAYCSDPELAKQLGGGSWRLPTKIELESIVDLSRVAAHDTVFDTYPTDYFWSASPMPNPEGLKLSWALDFSEGYSYAGGRFKAGRPRCVSGGSESGGKTPNYSSTADTVTDRSTRLVWQRYSDDATRNWADARRYCEELELDGGGWRLPTLKELLTLVDPTRRDPAITTKVFMYTPDARYWSSTEYLDSTDRAFHVDFSEGASLYAPTDGQHYTRCVR